MIRLGIMGRGHEEEKQRTRGLIEESSIWTSKSLAQQLDSPSQFPVESIQTDELSH